MTETKYAELQKEYQAQLKKLEEEEEVLIQDLNNMLNQKTFLEDKIKGIAKLIPTLKLIKHEAQDLVNTVNDISKSSEKISGKIRALDSARSRVDECQARVSDLIDLEICSQGVQAAILDSDYEKGAAHIHRFLSMDQSLLKRTANDMDNVTDMLKSVRTLQDAASQLRAIVTHKFTEAVNTEDLISIERFFKIFPLLGLHEEGIKEFCSYLRTKIALTAEKNLKSAMNTPLSDKRHGVIYADTLTLLYEGLARVIDTHQPLIETYYGPGRLLSAISILQRECDIQTKRVLLEWTKTRNIQKKVQLISDLSRMSSTSSFNKLEKIDPKDLDILIGEITLMHFRIELYIRFIQRKVTTDAEVGIPNQDDKNEVLQSLEKLIKNSDLDQCKHDLLSHYLRLEQYYMEESVAKAVSMDIIEAGQQTSSMVDDTFFIIRKCIRRSVSTGSLDGICVIINNACRVLESDFGEILRNRLRQGYPSGYLDLTQAYNVLQTSIQQGRLQSGDTEQSRMAFLVALNNADSSTEYVDALCDNVLKEIQQALPKMNSNERGKLESCLSGLSSVTTNLKDIIDYGIQQLRSSAIKPRINPWVDQFLNVNHHLTEDELSAYEAGESFIQTLIMNLETLLSFFKDILTNSNYDSFTQVLTAEVTQRFEKVIMKSTFNRLGGLVLDKEVRSLAGYITAATSWSVRDKFARLTQIATVLNLEQVHEIYDYWGNHDSALTWRLTPSELRTVMALRSDFKYEDIRRLKL
ncbi:conserved oligomeric Golgi complex subunit 4 [Diorhabda carinulata]|uniref:conserved oligomeric Golgi complex subunit 4 n=1 Tax=Diorhabda carinulata TaxID=1163345 RepID=UPI0025A25D01|nr:conserved oligomeric Golgi complex subunit 4 [Diorhabda carinulata]XP_057669956.1 conserved oligomeric Golgi complex subunit 4 [Diorhabda carinulata]